MSTTIPGPVASPQVNLNGTELEQLLKQHHQVIVACRKLDEALAFAAPHGRDYQTLPEGSISLARELWLVRKQYCKEIHDWAEMRVTDLMRQNVERNGGEKAWEIVRRVIP